MRSRVLDGAGLEKTLLPQPAGENTSRTLKFTLLTLFQHDTCGLQRIGLTCPFCVAGTARSDFHTRLNL